MKAVRPSDVFGWMKHYENKTGEAFKLPPGYCLWADHTHGFVMWKIDGDYFWLNQCTGDFKHWFDLIMKFAKSVGCKRIAGPTMHDPRVFKRLFGGEFAFDYTDENGVKYSVFVREVE